MPNLKHFVQKIKRRLSISSMGFIGAFAGVLLLQVVLMPFAWLKGWITGDGTSWYFQMLEELRKNISTSFASSVVGGAILIAGYLVNRNKDKVPDKFEDEKQSGGGKDSKQPPRPPALPDGPHPPQGK